LARSSLPGSIALSCSAPGPVVVVLVVAVVVVARSPCRRQLHIGERLSEPRSRPRDMTGTAHPVHRQTPPVYAIYAVTTTPGHVGGPGAVVTRFV